MSRRGLTIIGLAAAGGAGYYLYSAGGNPKAAEKRAEADLHKASAKLQGEMHPREAEKRGEAFAQKAGDKVDHAAAEVQRTLEEARKEANHLASKAGEEINKFNKGVNDFDKTVTEKAAKAKTGISSWFNASK